MAKEKTKHDSLLCLLLALIVVLILAIGGGVYYFIVSGDEGNNDKPIQLAETMIQEDIDKKVKENVTKYFEILEAEEAIQWLEILKINNTPANKYTNIVEGWRKTDIKYEDFKTEILKCVTEDMLESSPEINTYIKKEEDSTISFITASKDSKDIVNVEVVLVEKNENNFVYDVNLEKEEGKKEAIKVLIKKIDSNYLVDKVVYIAM